MLSFNIEINLWFSNSSILIRCKSLICKNTFEHQRYDLACVEASYFILSLSVYSPMCVL